MRVSVTFTAEVDVTRFREKADTSKMSEWSSKIAERLKTQKSVKENTDSVFLERRKLIKTHGPSLWQEVKTQTKTHCDDLNRDMGEQVALMEDSGRRINVNGKTAQGIRRLAADFDADKSLLSWKAEANSKMYEVSVSPDGKASLYQLSDKGQRLLTRPDTPQSVAQEMLDALFTGLFSDGI